MFTEGPELRHDSDETRAGYAERLVRGGFPEAVARTAPRRRTSFLDSYLRDLVSLRHLAGRLGPDFLVGIVLYTGRQTLPFGDRMRAMPISALWECAPTT